MSDKDFDEHLRKAAEQYEVPPMPPTAWNQMQQQLDQSAGVTGHFGYGSWLIGTVAMILLGLTVWLVTEPVSNEKKELSNQKHATEHTPANKEHDDQQEQAFSPAEHQPSNEQTAGNSSNDAVTKYTETGKLPTSELASRAKASAKDTHLSNEEQVPPVVITQVLPDRLNGLPLQPFAVVLPEPVAPLWSVVPDQNNGAVAITPKPSAGFGKVRLSLMVSPDFSSINLNTLFNRTGKMGSMGIEFMLHPRLSINSGINMSEKVYSVQGYERYPASYQKIPGLIGIDGSCQVLDIPVNLRYYALIRAKNKIYLSGGFSSYLMLKERYAFKYYYPQPDYVIQARQKNRHPFDIINLSIGFERTLGKRWALQAEPFVKLPMDKIGEAHLKLATGGVLLNVSYNLNFIHPGS